MPLVLSRKTHESIRIGRDIIVTVADVDRGKVRLAITAPRDVEIMRTELIRSCRVCNADIDDGERCKLCD